MTARTFAEDRPDERYSGRALPWYVCVRMAAPFPALSLGMYVVFGTLSALLVAFAVANCLLASFVYLGSRLRNSVEIHPDHLTIFVWAVIPLGTAQVRYERITRIEADDSSGDLAIWFKNEAGEPDVAEIVLGHPSAASKARDAILQRRGFLGADDEETKADDLEAISPAAILPELPDKKFAQAVETPSWMKWGLAVGGLLGLAAAFIGGGVGAFSFGNFIGLEIFILAMTLLIAAIEIFQTYFFLHFDRVDMRSGIGGTKHRIKFADVVAAEGTETGWLEVTYAKKPTLGFGGGQATAGIRLKRHSLAPVVADAIKLGRDRARRNAGARGWQAGEGRG